MVEAYRLLAERTDHPLHLGVTEAGPPPSGLIKSVAGVATLLLEGIGDTIRFSLTADPVEEAEAGRRLLEVLGLRERRGLDLIACPSCGRAEVDVIAVTREVERRLQAEGLSLQVAVMGCVVNGPGEARQADLGIAAGKGKGHLFVKGRVVRVVPEAEMVEALVEEGRRLAGRGSRGPPGRGRRRPPTPRPAAGGLTPDGYPPTPTLAEEPRALVPGLHPHAAAGSRRRRSRQPSPAGARRLHPPADERLLLAAAPGACGWPPRSPTSSAPR